MKRKAKSLTARDTFLRFMDAHGLKPHPWATKAGIRSSTIYNFLAGKSDNLSSQTLQRLAKAAGVTVDELLGGVPAKAKAEAYIPVTEVIGIFGRLYPMTENEAELIECPIGVPVGVEVLAAKVDGDGLHPIQSGWYVFYEKTEREPSSLIGKLSVVAVKGQPQRLVRQLQKGSTAGLYTLIAWSSGPIADVEVTSAHAVLSISQKM